MTERAIFKPPIPRAKIEWKARRVLWNELTPTQQAQAERLCAHHARNVEFVRPHIYASWITHWEINQEGSVVGWISGHPESSVLGDVIGRTN